MSSRKSIIDYLDLELHVPEQLKTSLENALKLFVDQHDYVEVQPSFKKGRLLINSTDAISLLGYLDQASLSEIELRRLKKLFASGVDQALLKSVSLDARKHYKWCLTALKSFTIGRFIEFEDNEK